MQFKKTIFAYHFETADSQPSDRLRCDCLLLVCIEERFIAHLNRQGTVSEAFFYADQKE